MNNLQQQVLLVDDDPEHLSLVERYTSALGVGFVAVSSALDAMKCLQESTFDVIVTDMVMPVLDGIELLRYTRAHHPGVDVIVMTGFSKHYTYMDVIRAGATDFIAKPFQKDEFGAKLSRLFRERALFRDLLQAKERAEMVSKAKTDFLNTISHELRTPMNGIIGFTGLLSSMDLPEKSLEYLDMVSQSADRLMKLINQILDFSRLDAGREDLMPMEIALQKFFESISPDFEYRAKAKGLSLRVEIDQTLPPKKLFGDPTVLAQIFSHLVSNAVKFSEQGEITIEVVVSEMPAPDSILLQFSVSDNGCGLGQDQTGTIFEPFTQTEEYMTRKHGGLGLGLAICSKLVRLLNGRIWVESELGKGAKFFFTARFGLV